MTRARTWPDLLYALRDDGVITEGECFTQLRRYVSEWPNYTPPPHIAYTIGGPVIVTPEVPEPPTKSLAERLDEAANTLKEYAYFHNSGWARKEASEVSAAAATVRAHEAEKALAKARDQEEAAARNLKKERVINVIGGILFKHFHPGAVSSQNPLTVEKYRGRARTIVEEGMVRPW